MQGAKELGGGRRRRRAREVRDPGANAERGRAARRVAGRGARARRSRTGHGRRRAHARGALRHSCARRRAPERRVLHRCDRLTANPGRRRERLLEDGVDDGAARADRRPDGARHRRADARRDRSLDPGRDPRRPRGTLRRPAQGRPRAASTPNSSQNRPVAKVLCVLYDDPVDGYPPAYARDGVPEIAGYHGGADDPVARGDRLHARRAARQRLRRARAAELHRGARPPADGHVRQGRARLGLRARASGRGDRHLAAVLARVPDRRADRQGAEPEAGRHRRHRVRPRRPPGRDRERDHGRRGHVLELDQRRRARRDDDPGARSQLPALEQDRARRRLEHRGRRLAVVRPGGHAGRDRRRGPHRLGRAPPPEAVRGRAPLHGPPPAACGGRAGARRHVPRDSEELVAVCDVVTINAPLHPRPSISSTRS